MKQLEIIEIRCAAAKAVRLENKLELIRKQFLNDSQSGFLKLFKRAEPYTDYCIHIYQHTGNNESPKESCALHILEVLKDYGLVNYTVWMEFGIES